MKNDIAVVIVTLFLGLLVVARIITSAMMVDESVAETVISRQQAIEIAQDYAKKRGMHVGEATKVWLEKKKMMGDGLNWRVQMLWQGGYGPVSLITVDATTGDVVDARGSRR